ncbi:MAG: hypothetical protein GWN00_20155, partial [Aliifodinibius sp.]|nr:glycosyltransferase [Fodinibius sp.]NIY27036.1 hypothetical protein [Fodinibius sp.]
MLQLNGLAIYPILFQDSSGANTAKVIFPVFKPNVFITLYDIWMGAYTPQDHTRPTGLSSIHPHWIPIVMVDHDPIPENTLRSAGEAYKIITPTQFGVKEFERQGLGHKTYYLPFGIDTTLFKPTIDKTPHVEELIKKTVPFNKMNALEWKKDDIFLIGTNGANKDPYRKAFDRMFIATQIFLQQNPDAIKDTRFYVHSWMRMARDIPHLAKALGIDHICRAPTDYHMLQSVPLESMASMYNSLDLYLHLSQGGGFEIPILEAMTSG